MSVNLSSFNVSGPFSPALFDFSCFDNNKSFVIFLSFAVINTSFIVPLYSLVLYVGVQRWTQQRSTSTTTAASPADVLTYHAAAMEIVSLMGSVFHGIGSVRGNQEMLTAGMYTFSMIYPGQTLFHTLTCVERYLAVVHPITYLSLKSRDNFRNITTGCVWMMSFGWLVITHLYFPDLAVVPFLSFFVVALLISSFCSISVLCALSRPSPGDSRRDRERVDQSKQRASHIVMAVMGVLMLRFAGLVACMIAFGIVANVGGDACSVLSSSFWFCLPSGLVLPLLFLHRKGKLPCCP